MTQASPLSPRHVLIAIVLGACTSPCAGFDTTAAVQAPVRCQQAPSCGSDITLADAEHSYAQNKEALSRQKDPKRARLARLDDYTPAAMVDKHICGQGDVLGFYYFWAPAQELPDGDAAVKRLASGLQRTEPQNGYLHVQAAESGVNERHFALCRVTTISGISGPPRECTTVAIALPDRIMLRASNHNQPWCYTAASFRASGAIQIEYEIDTRLSVSQISTSIASTLQGQFNLAVDKEEVKDSQGRISSAYMRSTAGLRDSAILPSGWRESLDVDVSVSAQESILAVRGTVHALVSRQAVGSLTNYSGLDDAQRSLYSLAFDSGIGKAIQSVCKTFRKLDAKRVICGN